MNNLAGIVKSIAVSTDDKTVVIELICENAYGAAVFSDDIISRLKTDKALKLTVKVGATIEGGAES